ncbi:hypothetical protein HZ994_09735 [Akkermansiaceae bacterium]|nr:hypothetical protein HZ994_09735 [Akkermansiaceae bacterium]
MPAPAKQGMPAMAWVGIGCGGLLAIAIIAGILIAKAGMEKLREFTANPEKSAAEMIVSMSPELSRVSQDDAKGTMTIRTKDGKEMTLSYQDIAAGKISVTDENGNITTIGSTDLSKLPAWVPKPDDLSDAVSLFQSDSDGQFSGQFSGNSAMAVDDLKSFYETQATSLGLSSNSSSSMNLNSTTVCTLEYSGGGKSLKVIITAKPGSRRLVNTHYSEN